MSTLFLEFVSATVQCLKQIRDNPTTAKVDDVLLELQTLLLSRDGEDKHGPAVEVSPMVPRCGRCGVTGIKIFRCFGRSWWRQVVINCQH